MAKSQTKNASYRGLFQQMRDLSKHSKGSVFTALHLAAAISTDPEYLNECHRLHKDPLSDIDDFFMGWVRHGYTTLKRCLVHFADKATWESRDLYDLVVESGRINRKASGSAPRRDSSGVTPTTANGATGRSYTPVEPKKHKAIEQFNRQFNDAIIGDKQAKHPTVTTVSDTVQQAPEIHCDVGVPFVSAIKHAVSKEMEHLRKIGKTDREADAILIQAVGSIVTSLRTNNRKGEMNKAV